MGGKHSLNMNFSDLPPDTLVHDIVYTPLYTDMLVEAQKRGNPVVTGIGMLLHQAREGFKHWHGLLPDVTPELQEMVMA
jgi:shikimate dehydrogenase